MDKLIDLASAPPRGTGVQNIREVIIENKMTFDVSADEWQAYLKNKIMNNIERYFYLIVFAMYVREVGPKDFPLTFRQWMDEHEALRTMIAEGRSKLEWERKIPDEKLGELRGLLEEKDFKANLPKVRSMKDALQGKSQSSLCILLLRSSSGSTSWRGSSSPTFLAATTRTTRCTSWRRRRWWRSCPRS